jgi:hypothetical protein
MKCNFYPKLQSEFSSYLFIILFFAVGRCYYRYQFKYIFIYYLHLMVGLKKCHKEFNIQPY